MYCVVVVHAFNPSYWKAEAGKSLISWPDRSTENFQKARITYRNTIYKKKEIYNDNKILKNIAYESWNHKHCQK